MPPVPLSSVIRRSFRVRRFGCLFADPFGALVVKRSVSSGTYQESGCCLCGSKAFALPVARARTVYVPLDPLAAAAVAEAQAANAESKCCTVIDYVSVTREAPCDSDVVVTHESQGPVVVLRLEKGRTYDFEVHQQTEISSCISGSFVLETAEKNYVVHPGSAIRVPAGVRHRWGAQSEAVVLTHFGKK